MAGRATLFEQCVEAVEKSSPAQQMLSWSDDDGPEIVRAVIQTLIDHTPSPRTVDELTRILGEA